MTISLFQSNHQKIAKNARKRHADLQRYWDLQTMFGRGLDLHNDQEFQSTYRQFYKVVWRNEQWIKIYFEIFNREKANTNICFQKVICELLDRTGRIEPSFSSKMIATINPHRPVYDKIVLGHLGLRAPYPYMGRKIRLDRSIDNYHAIYEHHKKVIEYPAFGAEIDNWDGIFPKFSEFTPMKKLDLMLWLLR